MKKLSKKNLITLVETKSLTTEILETTSNLADIESWIMDLEENSYTDALLNTIVDLLEDRSKNPVKAVKEVKKPTTKKPTTKKPTVKKEATKEATKEVKKPEAKKETKKEVKTTAKVINLLEDIKPGLTGILEVKELQEKFYFKVASKSVKQCNVYPVTNNTVLSKVAKVKSKEVYSIDILGGNKELLLTADISTDNLNKKSFRWIDESTNEVLHFKVLEY